MKRKNLLIGCGLVLALSFLVIFVLFALVAKGCHGCATGASGAGQAALVTAQAELVGRLGQLADTQDMAQKRLDERLADVSRRVGESLEKTSQKAQTSMTELRERMAVIDRAQKNITELSNQMVGLQDILANKQARGAFGEIQLNDLVTSILPPSAYDFQATLSNQRRVDCLIQLPKPPGPIAIDAKFPLESYHALRQAGNEAEMKAAQRAFRTAIGKHIKDIQERYILPSETADSALMFLPSEAVYAELHGNFPEMLEQSYRARVWIVSPTTLMATLNTVRAVLKDARMREQAGVIQAEVVKLLDDVQRLDERAENLQRHFKQAEKDLEQIAISTKKITRRVGQIEDVQLTESEDDTLNSAQEDAREHTVAIVDLPKRGA